MTLEIRTSLPDGDSSLKRHESGQISADERKETPELRSDLGKAFDMTFGRGASKKTFGTAAPSIGQMEEFFDKFIPLANKWLGGE